MDLAPVHRQALLDCGRIVAQVTPGDLARESPCAGWNLADLLGHMIGQHRGFAAAARGLPVDPAVWEDVTLGPDPAADYAVAADDVLAAFAAEDFAGRTLALHGFGHVPAATAMMMHFVDYLAHGWDVARTLGVPADLDEELCERALRLGSRWPADSPSIWGPGAPFGAKVPVPAGASAADRFLGFLGRTP
ncbi:TIGR03086 family metal-binding protein [Longispora sp. K20-0274]|uniref:TIGR03086 family metal-binding protein n=1 Tax=Longispora sp. K20-0274 TaxID=3088255 RepID=UPI0039997800